MRFVDKVRIHAKAGRGGNGCLSFRREKYVEFGGPDGGDGGRGGDILLQADPHMATLLDLTYRPHLVAGDGSNGRSSGKTGRDAEDLAVRVPLGTLIYKGERLIADMAVVGARVLVARGGRGGRGNLSFKSQHNTAPRIYEKGEPGERAELDLELKLIADVGLIGFPNAGKSTFLSRVSNARPKIADYPFTTLAPHLGIVGHKQASFVLADIPGLIEGAHQGKGLGLDFLRHVERTRILIHLVDPLGFNEVSAVNGVRKIEDELRSHSRMLADKPKLLVVNKMDLPEGAEALARIKARYRKRKVFGISSASGEGVHALLDGLLDELSRRPAELAQLTVDSGPESVRVDPGFRISRLGPGLYQVLGRYVERVAAMSDLALIESVNRMQQTLRKIGVDKALRLAGVQEGDMVRIGALELEWTQEPRTEFIEKPRRPLHTAAREARGRPRQRRD